MRNTDQAICGLLKQDDELVFCVSRTLKGAELNYSTIEQEMLAIKYTLGKLRKFLLGRQFKLYTDHEPLLGVIRARDHANKRLMRYKTDVAEFALEDRIYHVKMFLMFFFFATPLLY